MELIHGEGVCQTFLDNWDLEIPRIVKMAFRSTSTSVKSVLKFYQKESLLLRSKGIYKGNYFIFSIDV